MKRLFAALVLPLALAACGQDQELTEAAADSDRRAEGEVLGGTIDDSMLPLETVRSRAPLASSDPESGASAGNADAAQAPASDTPPPAPASDPADEDGAEPQAEAEGEAASE